MSIKNSKRDPSNTHRVIASVFPRVRKDNKNYFINDKLIHKKDWSYRKEVYPNIEQVLNDKKNIKENLLVYDNINIMEDTITGEMKQKKPIGWVSNFHFNDKYTDIPKLYTSLIFDLRIFKNKLKPVLKLYKKNSIYDLRFCPSYEPIVSWELVNNIKKPKITGVKFRYVSVTDNSLFSCPVISSNYCPFKMQKNYKYIDIKILTI